MSIVLLRPRRLSCSPRCAANREPFCNCRRPAGNSVYAVPAMFPEARSCEDCVEAGRSNGVSFSNPIGATIGPGRTPTLRNREIPFAASRGQRSRLFALCRPSVRQRHRELPRQQSGVRGGPSHVSDAQDCYECMRLGSGEHGGLAYPENWRMPSTITDPCGHSTLRVKLCISYYAGNPASQRYINAITVR